MTGRFITLEGGEGAGKSTQIRLLADRLRGKGLAVQTTREPGGAPGAEAIRKLLVAGEPGRWTPMTETLLHFAARSDHLARTINPARAQGIWVISDRFADSTRAYQGAGQGIEPDVVASLYDLTVGADGPDLTLILDLPVEVGLKRAAGRGGAEDRYERMGIAFHQTLRAGFLSIAQAEPGRCVVIDADAPVELVSERIWAAVCDRLAP